LRAIHASRRKRGLGVRIHEWQAKAILRRQGVATPDGEVVATSKEAVEAAKRLGRFPVAIKAQTLTGGRGKAGGVKLAVTPEEARACADAILGMTIKGLVVRRVLVEAGVDMARELYASIALDRDACCMAMIVSASGGVDIESVASDAPDRVLKLPIRPELGLCPYQVHRAACFLDVPKESRKAFAGTLNAMERVARETDALLVEINPLGLTSRGEVIACDAKIDFDDNALALHPDLAELRDESQEEPLEAEARRHRLSYVKLDGEIGCLVNGAGLAMATMDAIRGHGGRAANFMDIGGDATPERVVEALRIVASDKGTRVILFNIFGGIVRCDRVAEGILQAKQKLDLRLPIVMRLAGANEDKAKALLAGTDLIMLPTLDEAGPKAVELARASVA
jgi:succinyl-CoA synthetase beta subunit